MGRFCTKKGSVSRERLRFTIDDSIWDRWNVVEVKQEEARGRGGKK